MTIDQIWSIVGGATQTTIFAGLFIWLFLDSRKEQGNREQQARIDRAEAEKKIREHYSAEEAKAEAREQWFRATIEKFQVVEAGAADIQRRTLEKLDMMDKRLERLEGSLGSRKGV